MISQQNEALTEERKAAIEHVLEAHDYDGTQIVGILLDVQNLEPMHYVSEEAACFVAKRLRMRITNVYDILCFYDRLSYEPRARYPIEVCDSAACRVNDSRRLAAMLKEILGIDFGETTYDGRFRLERVTCFGACDSAPAVRICGKIYGHLDTEQDVRALLERLK